MLSQPLISLVSDLGFLKKMAADMDPLRLVARFIYWMLKRGNQAKR